MMRNRPVAVKFKGIRLMLSALCSIACLLVATSAGAADTGIEGTVVWGPISPGPERMGQDDEAPLRAAFVVYGPDKVVARFETDDEGRFTVSLPPGDYTIVPSKQTPIRNPGRQKTEVTVPADGYAIVTIRLDTGMR